MINFININKSEPYLKFNELYDLALNKNQIAADAASISSYSVDLREVNSRFVNIKFIENDSFIFFTNYNSPKALEFQKHTQIAASFFWSAIDVQIRLRANISKTSATFNNEYFKKRAKEKNALAISSKQSNITDSYESVVKKYKHVLKNEPLHECPEYWGGYSFVPYYFEFWKGDSARINFREGYVLKSNKWNKFLLEP